MIYKPKKLNIVGNIRRSEYLKNTTVSDFSEIFLWSSINIFLMFLDYPTTTNLAKIAWYGAWSRVSFSPPPPLAGCIYWSSGLDLNPRHFDHLNLNWSDVSSSMTKFFVFLQLSSHKERKRSKNEGSMESSFRLPFDLDIPGKAENNESYGCSH